VPIERDWLDELADQAVPDTVGTGVTTKSAAPGRMRAVHHTGLWAVLTFITVAVVGGALLLDAIGGAVDAGPGAAASALAAQPSLVYDLAGAASVSAPYLGASSGPTASGPLGIPSPLVETGSSYEFRDLQSDGVTPVAWDPCRPVHYVVRTAGAPPGGAQLIAAAVAQVSRATGLRFMYDGTTSEDPSDQRLAVQRASYGDRWVPVLITWATPDEVPALAGEVTGQAGSMPLREGANPIVYVSGQLTLDGPQLARILDLEDGVAIAHGVVLHELGHLVGLADVDDSTQLMHAAETTAVTSLGASDLTGLAALGRGACVPMP